MIIIMQHTIYSKSDKMKLILGDCIEKMKEMQENSIDAIITDPPYGLEFMGKEWDKFKKDASWNKRGKDWHEKFGNSANVNIK